MRKSRYPLSHRYMLGHVETFYPDLTEGFVGIVTATGKPAALGVGQEVEVIDPGPSYAAYVRAAALSGSDKVLCRAIVSGVPLYGWVALSWLEPITAQRSLFAVEQPVLF